MKSEENIIQLISDEADDFYSNDDLYRIRSWGADLSFRELIAQYDTGELIKPEMQRNYVWDKSEASRFIDSLLLGLPVPSIFLALVQNEIKLIVDGFQRIMTIHDFVNGIFSKDGKVFKLTNSVKINSRWRGKAFSELSESEQRKIRNTTIHSIIFTQVEPREGDTSIYQIFERINTSGRTLLPQEIRNCVYQGRLNTLLIELNRFIVWRDLYGLENPDSRMRDIEFILRVFSLASGKLRTETVEQISLKKFLNEYMGEAKYNSPVELEKNKQIFLEVITYLHSSLGKEAFQNISSKDPTKFVNKFNPTIYDSIFLATLKATPLERESVASELKERRLLLLQQSEFQDLIRIRTTRIDRINSRIEYAYRYLYHT